MYTVRLPKSDFTADQLIEALTKSRGFILAAKKYLYNVYGIKTGQSTIKNWIKEWGMEEWLDEIRRSLVEDCLNKTFAKGVAEGDNACLFWVLEKYSHHIDFLGGKDTETESKKGWREILDHVKRPSESNTKTEPDREHRAP